MRFLVIWEQGGGWGHIARFGPVAKELLRRGHEVVMAVRDQPGVATLVPGARVLPLPATPRPPARASRPAADFTDILVNIGWHADVELERLATAWLSLIDDVTPDALILDHSPTALLASGARRIPRVLLSTGFTRPPDVSPPPSLSPGAAPPVEERLAAESLVLARANAWLAARGGRSLERLSQLFARAELDILATWPELDHYGARAGVSYAGVWSNVPGTRPAWPTGRGPRVFVYVKDFPSRPALMQMLQRSGLPVLACLPDASAECRSRWTTGAVRVVGELVDLPWAARGVGLAVLNAGHGATAQMLRAGTPLLQIPLVMEQFLVARRTLELGAGQMSLPDAPAQIAQGLQRLLTDDRFTAAADAFRKRHASFDGGRQVDAVVDRILAAARA